MNLEQIVFSTTLANTAISGATELAAVTASGVQVPRDGASLFLYGWLAVTPPGSTTTLRAQIRRGAGITGTSVADTGLITNGPAASAVGTISVVGSDAITNVAGGQYTLTILCTAGSGAGTVNFGGLVGFLLT